MAKKKSHTVKHVSPGKQRKQRKHRTPEQRIADLQEEIERIKSRAHAKSLKSSAAMKAAISAVKALDKGLEAAAEESNAHLRHALADARRVLGTHLEGEGLKLPKANLPKGPRPK